MSGTITRIGVTGAGALLALGIFATPPAGATGGRDGKGERKHAACFNDSGKTQGRSQSDPDGMTNGGLDKPGCTGGFDADRDGNNGCGNDADREDDNNGRCGRKKDRPATEPRADKVKADKMEADKRERRSDDTRRDRDGRCGKPEGSTTTTTTGPAVAGASATSGKCACALGSEAEFSAVKVSTVSAAVVASGTTVNGTTVAPTDTALAAAGTTGDAGTPAVAGTAAEAGTAGTAGTAPTAVEAASSTAPGTEVLGESITRPSVLARTGAGLGGLALLGGLLCGSGRVAILARRFLRID